MNDPMYYVGDAALCGHITGDGEQTISKILTVLNRTVGSGEYVYFFEYS
jgi:hypothetical protein